MLNPKLAKQLKDAGFPQEPKISLGGIDGEIFGGFYFVGMIDGDGAFCFIQTDGQNGNEYEKFLERDSAKYVIYKVPTLEELIEATGVIELQRQVFHPDGSRKDIWVARNMTSEQANKEMGETCDWAEGNTPEEAVANLYIKLTKTA